jgi:metal-responsive CopG/Arc/MetJ family transcriptional regulator
MGYKKTPNARPIINITIPDELLEEIENFRYAERKRNRSQAICQILELGLKTHREQKGPSSMKTKITSKGDPHDA